MGMREQIVKALLGKQAAPLAGKPGGVWEGGIRAYHSSPHDFDRVDFSKLRTGEGANVYGAGHYMAENPAVSGQGGQYWGQFSRRFQGSEADAADYLALHKFDRQAAAKAAREQLEKNIDFAKSVRSADELASLSAQRASFEKTVQMLEGNAPIGPRTYEMNLRAKPEELLDWDKALGAQSKYVQERLAPDIENWHPSEVTGTKGQDLYRRLHSWDKPDTYASDQLRDLGIPGIRYLDEGSRPNAYMERELERKLDMAQQQHAMAMKSGNADYIARERANLAEVEAAMKRPPPTYNYVGTDPSKLDILAKYGIAGAAAIPPTLGAFTRQDTYEARP